MRLLRAITTLLVVVLASACAHAPVTESDAAFSIRAMTYNVRLDTASDGANAWPHRKQLVAALIRHEAPDIIGLQEVLLVQRNDLAESLQGYSMIGVGRDDGKEAGEFAPLGWRSAIFSLVDHGTFWLSTTPDRPSTGWDAALPRLATWAVLRHNRTGRDIRVLNTHFDHVGTQAREEAARMIAAWVADGEAAGSPTIVLGDFNVPTESPPYRALVGGTARSLRDARRISATEPYGPPGTFTGWAIDRDAPAPIDHIFVTGDWVVQRHWVSTQHWGGRLPSDHYPVMADLELQP